MAQNQLILIHDIQARVSAYQLLDAGKHTDWKKGMVLDTHYLY